MSSKFIMYGITQKHQLFLNREQLLHLKIFYALIYFILPLGCCLKSWVLLAIRKVQHFYIATMVYLKKANFVNQSYQRF